MANRTFVRDSGALEKGTIRLWAKVAIGSTGACTLSAANSKGVTSITRNSAGDYSLVLDDAYQKLLGFQVTFQTSTGLPAAPVVGLKTITLTAASKLLRFVCTTVGAGSATDPGSGETMYISISVSNSTAL